MHHQGLQARLTPNLIVKNLNGKTMEMLQTTEIELTKQEADALNNFLKHSTSNDYKLKAKSPDEAYLMVKAVRKVREAIKTTTAAK